MTIYRTKGTCAKEIIFEVDNNIINDVKFVGGCSGNLQGIARLAKGLHIDKVIGAFETIRCRNNTSCPAQFAAALKDFKTASEHAGETKITVSEAAANADIK